MMNSPRMVPRPPTQSDTAARNDPALEAAFQSAPADKVAEILAGRLYLSPRPARAHANVESNLGGLLIPPFKFGSGGPGGWVLLYEPELHLGRGPDKVVPDLAGWRRGCLPDAVGATEAPAHDDLAPDWVCEVLSPSTRRVDEGEKMRIYAREGVQHLWHVDPLARTLSHFRLDEGHWRSVLTCSGEAPVRVEPFDALELPLALLWSR